MIRRPIQIFYLRLVELLEILLWCSQHKFRFQVASFLKVMSAKIMFLSNEL